MEGWWLVGNPQVLLHRMLLFWDSDRTQKKKQLSKFLLLPLKHAHFIQGEKTKVMQPPTDRKGSMRYTPDYLFGLNSWACYSFEMAFRCG